MAGDDGIKNIRETPKKEYTAEDEWEILESLDVMVDHNHTTGCSDSSFLFESPISEIEE